MGQHWLKQWLVAWRHQAITQTNVDLSSNFFCGINMGEHLQEELMKLIRNACLDVTLLQSLPHFQGDNELIISAPEQRRKSKWSGGRFKNTYELLNQRALKFSYVNKIHIFQCMGKIFCVEFQRYPLKFHTKYLTHTLKDMIFMQFWNFKSS